MRFGSMGTKMWRTRVRSLFLSFILFGLGVMTCLVALQVSRGSPFDTSIVINPQEFVANSPPVVPQMPSKAESPPCDASNNNNHQRTDNNRDHNSIVRGTRSPPVYYEEVSQHIVGRIALPPVPDNGFLGSVEKDGGEVSDVINDNVIEDSLQGSPGVNRRKTLKRKTNSVYYSSKAIDSSTLQVKKVFGDTSSNNNNNARNDTTVWVVTPTYYRPEQKPELTRLAQALLPVNHFVHWLVVDDVSQGTEVSLRDLRTFLDKFSLNFTLLKSFPPKSFTKIVGKPRGVGGRRAAISWLRKNAQDGVVYFADDDNTYDSDIFHQMQRTQKVSMWPVGLVTDLGVSSPIVKNGRVVGFYDGWNGLRKFPVDMAGFAINMKLFHSKPKANMPWVAGYEEDELLRSLEITMQDIEPLANNCTEILVWHTKAIKNVWPKRPKNLKPTIAVNTNLNKLLKSLPQKSLAGPAASQSKSESGFSFLHFIFGGL